MRDTTTTFRWWPAALILAGAVIALMVQWWGEGTDTQMRVLNTYQVLAATLALLLVWLLFLSALRWRLRLGLFAAVVALGGLFAATFRIVGVDGNLLPVLAFRWSGEGSFESGSGAADVATSPFDFPQFLGPDRSGQIDSVRLAGDWQASPPVELWRREVGAAWSGFSVVGDAAVTLEQRDGQEVVVRYALESGEVVWTQAVDAVFDTTIGGSGPRSTPTIHAGRVYTVGATGIIRAVDLVSGALIWRRDLGEDHGSQAPSWGFSGSPLVVDLDHQAEDGPAESLVVVPAGGKGSNLVAYRASDGEPAWAAGDDRIGYSSPSRHVLAGVPQIVIFNGGSIAGHAPDDGRQLWTYPWSSEQPNVAQPLPLGEDRLLVSSGYGIGSSLLQLIVDDAGTWSVEQLWKSPRMKAKFTNLVEHEGFIYGLDDGVLVCLDPATGKRRWKRGRYGHGQILLVSDALLVQTEAGEVVMLDPNPDEHRELGKIQALDGKSWNNPTVAGSILLVRDADEAAAYRLTLAE
ncbi:MAG: PQQ-binding-like beta-propeller repeat protein [Acidobacteriota bacterium]